MTLWTWTYLGNPLSRWLLAIGMTIATVVAVGLARRLAVGWLTARGEHHRTELGDLAVHLLKETRSFFAAALAVYVGGLTLTLPGKDAREVSTVIGLAILAQTGLWGSALISFAVARYVERQAGQDAGHRTTISALGFFGKLVLLALIVLLGLDNLGVKITALIAGLGIGGIAVGLAAQNVLSDLFASFAIVLDKPFLLGDFISVDDYMGVVEHIGVKTTRIRSLSGEEIVFSNGDLLKSRIRNYKRMYERRVVFALGVTYETSYEHLRAIPEMIRAIVERQPRTRFDRAHFKEYGDSALVFEIVYYVRDPDYSLYMDTQQAINLDIYERFAAEGIEFAYPTRTLYLREILPPNGAGARAGSTRPGAGTRTSG